MKNTVPTTWMSAPLHDLILFALGGDWGEDPDHHAVEYTDVRCIRASEFRDWNAEKGSSAALRRITASSLEARRLSEGDIVVEISGGGPEQPVGRTVLIDKPALACHPDTPKVCSNFCRLMRPATEISSSYLNNYLQYFYRSGRVSTYQGGSNNLRNLKFTDYLTISVPVPPLNEQLRIVTKIDELLSELDKGLESLKTTWKQLKLFRLIILDAAASGQLLVNRDLRPLPFGPEETTTLGQVVHSLGQGWSPRCHNHPSPDHDTWGVIKTTAIQHLSFDDTEHKELPSALKPRAHLAIEPGDILVTRAGPRKRVGVSCLVRSCRPRLILCDKAYRLRVDQAKALPEYLEKILNSPRVLQDIEELKTGINDSGVNLTQDRFLSLSIFMPPIEDQKTILAELDSLLSNIENVESHIDDALQREAWVRHSILTRAFSGQLVEQRQSDEPAAALLERVRSERAKTATSVRKKKIPNKKRKNAA